MAASKTGVVAATLDYENWLRGEVDVIEADLALKHRQMAASLFVFLRGTFYRWRPLLRRSAETSPTLRECWRWAICMWRISARGATRKEGWSGE